MAKAVGYAGIALPDFLSMTLHEVALVLSEREQRRGDDFEQVLFAARQICFYAVKPHIAKKSPIKKPSDLFELQMDKDLKKAKAERVKKGIEHFEKLRNGFNA